MNSSSGVVGLFEPQVVWRRACIQAREIIIFSPFYLFIILLISRSVESFAKNSDG